MNFESISEFNLSHFNFDNLTIFSLNARSLSSIYKFNSFKNLIFSLKKLPKIILVQETCFSEEMQNIYTIPGYTAVNCCRSDGYGGLSFFVDTEIAVKVEYIYNVGDCQAVSITLPEIKFNGKEVRINGVYRAPRNLKRDFDDFFGLIEDLVIQSTNYAAIFAGDFNIDLLTASNIRDDWINMMAAASFNCEHHLITRPSSGTSLDHLFSNCSENLSNIAVIGHKLSDHSILMTSLSRVVRVGEIVTSTYQKLDFEGISRSVGELLLNDFCSENPNDDYRRFHDSMKSIVENHTSKTRGSKDKRRAIVPWMNDCLVYAI